MRYKILKNIIKEVCLHPSPIETFRTTGKTSMTSKRAKHISFILVCIGRARHEKNL